MRTRPGSQTLAWCVVSALLGLRAVAANATLVGWSETGLHETDGSDVSVYALTPPYSTIHAQLVWNGKLLTNANGIAVTYEAVADATGSRNSTSVGKGNFYQYAQALFGTNLAPDGGLGGFGMPGQTNQPQAMAFDSATHVFTATGIPVKPYDDQGRKNPYPLMRLVARDATGNTLASTQVVLPVSDEMDCRSCHASGTHPDARPMAGWVWNCDPDVDTKLNILRYHDGVLSGSSTYSNVLAAVGYNTAGLYATVTQNARPVWCGRCHASNAIPGSGAPGMRALTRLMHTKHAKVTDPQTGLTLDDMNNNAACFRCHVSSSAAYVRGVHHNSVAADGSLAMPCQSCHGVLTDVGARTRQGWLDEPNCQSCHTGTARVNNGQIRYTNVYAGPGSVRLAKDLTFATQTNAPSAGLSLFRASAGHGGLQCAACHGSAHSEWPSSQANDNTQSMQLQTHTGPLADCAACHPTVPSTVNGGPHGLHPVGLPWISGHRLEGQSHVQCQDCHGLDYRGTALGRMLADRVLDVSRTSLFWQGFQIGCYNCHLGPNGEDDGGVPIPSVAASRTAATRAKAPVSVSLAATGSGLVFHIVSQPAHGTVSLAGNVATYYPAPGFLGADQFTFAAWNGATDSNLGTVAVTVNPGACSLTATATAPTAAMPNAPVAFAATASLEACAGAITYDWDFGDASPHGAVAHVCHSYAAAGEFAWVLKVTANGLTRTLNGVVTVSPTLGPPVWLTLTMTNGTLLLSWPADRVPTSLETSFDPGQPDSWQPASDTPVLDASQMRLEVLVLPGPQFYRLRRVP